MKKIILSIIIIGSIIVIGCQSTKVTNNRNYAYEAYCDSIWENDPIYYQDVLCETDEYCAYIDKYGEWWNN